MHPPSIDLLDDGDGEAVLPGKFYDEAHPIGEVFGEVATCEVWDKEPLAVLAHGTENAFEGFDGAYLARQALCVCALIVVQDGRNGF